MNVMKLIDPSIKAGSWDIVRVRFCRPASVTSILVMSAYKLFNSPERYMD